MTPELHDLLEEIENVATWLIRDPNERLLKQRSNELEQYLGLMLRDDWSQRDETHVACFWRHFATSVYPMSMDYYLICDQKQIAWKAKRFHAVFAKVANGDHSPGAHEEVESLKHHLQQTARKVLGKPPQATYLGRPAFSVIAGGRASASS
jgi:hypothetical protein